MGENSPMMWRKHPLPALLLSGSFPPPFSLPQVLHYTQKVCFTTRVHEEVLFTKDGEIPAMFDIYVLPDQSGQTTIVGHFDFRALPGKKLLITDSTVTWAEGLQGAAESCLRTQPTLALMPLSTQQYLFC